MIIAHYEHRLPIDYDLEQLRRRSDERGAVWDDVPDLYFKAFLIRQAGRNGAIANSFSSLYLWRNEQPFVDWLTRGDYHVVTDVFGRADIKTLFVVDAFRGRGRASRFLHREEVQIPLDSDLTTALSSASQTMRKRVAEPDVVAGAVGLDPRSWRLLFVLLSEDRSCHDGASVTYEVARLSSHLLGALPCAVS